jgi:hypothetical protein
VIEFVTLLIGLVTGPRAVGLVAHGEMAAIELHLDGQLVHRLEEEPWEAEVDFGQDLRPHRLEAFGFDSGGELLDSARQIVNYSRSSFEAAVVLDSTAGGPARSGRVVWEGAFQESPRRVDLHFDDLPLQVGPAGEFTLPAYDDQALHVLEAQVVFADGSTGMASRTLAGEFTDQTSTVLTAVPVRFQSSEPASTRTAQDWLEKNGRPLDAFTVTVPRGVLFILREDLLEKNPSTAMPWRQSLLGINFHSSASFDYDIIAICPRPMEDSPGTFRLSRLPRVNPRFGLTPFLVRRGSLVSDGKIDGRRIMKKGQKLFDSLAVAGLNAARRNTPRLVLLVIGKTLKDNSHLSPAQAVQYLESIHVPLLIWAPNSKSLEAYGLAGHSRVFFGSMGLRALEEAVDRELRSQSIIWVEGEHLPSEISLSAKAPPEVTFPH